MQDESLIMKLSIILPARNEAISLRALLPQLAHLLPHAEIIVVNDGSTDATASVAKEYGAMVISHPYPKGNGAAVKTGARNATGDVFVFMDADSQHRSEDVPSLLQKLDDGFDMVVGARISHKSHAGLHRAVANGLYNRFASWMTGSLIEDLTSGFRVVKASLFKRFLYLLPNRFSYPTTITMAFFRSGYSVAYVPIQVDKRIGRSHIRLIRDGIRFLLIIFKVGTLFSPLKLFAPAALFHALLGVGYYAFTFLTQHRLSSISVFMFTSSVMIFLIGLVSEQITALMYKDS